MVEHLVLQQKKIGLKNITLLDWISIFTKANYLLQIEFFGKDSTIYLFYEGKVRCIMKGDQEIMDKKTLKHLMEKMEDQSSLFEIEDDEDVEEETDEEVEDDYQNLKNGKMVRAVKERKQSKNEKNKVQEKMRKNKKL